MIYKFKSKASGDLIMLGPNGDSNGCVSFKDYNAFIKAFESGQIKRLAVVAKL